MPGSVVRAVPALSPVFLTGPVTSVPSHSHFTDEETEIQGTEPTSLRPHQPTVQSESHRGFLVSEPAHLPTEVQKARQHSIGTTDYIPWAKSAPETCKLGAVLTFSKS